MKKLKRMAEKLIRSNKYLDRRLDNQDVEIESLERQVKLMREQMKQLV